MKIMIAVALLLLPLFARADFFADTDIPIMDHIIINETDTFSFDTPAGQIISVSCKTPSTKEEVENFYRETLSALGWNEQSYMTYTRDQDKLLIKIFPTQQGTNLQLQLTYKNK